MAINDKNILILVGGVGGAKLAHGLAQILPPERLTVVVNTGDDTWHYGLRVCPDLDTVSYTLADWIDKTKGWGVAEDSFTTLAALRRLGEDAWFMVGDKDFATHLTRTQALNRGESLTAVTQKLTKALGIRQTILPMTDAVVATKLLTAEQGELDFQTYFVRERWQPTVTSIRFDGIEGATVSPEVAQAIDLADIILFGPSNPWLSIAPILAVPGLRERLIACDVPRVALSPIVGGEAIKGPAAKLMAEMGLTVTAATVADYYHGVINGFVYDELDANLTIDGLRSTIFDTIMRSDEDRAVLARKILDWIGSWGGSYEHLGNHSGQTTDPG
ncbi:MAG TPA: 2-phospho-L-lactate transferase [Phototrophicaceae bacterium]|nr:2-phospho-L-lactate transferase [Phototrophicaceae bacterium]